MVLQSIRELLKPHVCIERAFPTNKVWDWSKTAKSCNSSKRKIVSFNEKVPKKCHREKDCLLSKKHGGTHTTHNTPDCQKYDSNGTLKKNFNGKNANGTSHGYKRPHWGGSSYAQISAKIDKLEKSNRKMKCAINKKKCKHYDSDIDDSDTS